MVHKTHHFDFLINLGIEVGTYPIAREGPEEELVVGGLFLYMHSQSSYK